MRAVRTHPASPPERRTISNDDYLRLEGLLVLARDHQRSLDAITHSVAGLVGEEDNGYGYFGHVSDGVSEGYTGAELLEKMGIPIEGRQP